MKIINISAFLVFSILLLIIWNLIFKQQLPYRLYNSDVFHQLAVIKSFEELELGGMKEPYFAEGPVDLHAGPYYFLLYILSELLDVSYYQIILIFAFLNSIFLIVSLYFFAKSFYLNKVQSYFFVFFSLFGWGSFNIFFAGIYEFTSLIVTASFPATIGISFILLTVGLSKRFLATESSYSSLFLIAIFTISIIISHLLSGVVLISFQMLLILENCITQKKISRRGILLFCSILVSVILSCFVWPLFNLITLISTARTVQVGASDQVKENYFVIESWPSLIGLSIISIIFLPILIRKKMFFPLILFFFCVFMTISYLMPVRLSLFWRFFPFMTLCISYFLVIGIRLMNIKIVTFFLVTICAIAIVNITKKTTLLLQYELNNEHRFYPIKSLLSKDTVVLSDPNTSYHLAAFMDTKVVSVPYNHANPAIIPESKQRYEQTVDFFLKDMPSKKQSEFIKKYNVDYIIINTKYFPDFIFVDQNTNFYSHFTLKVPHTVVHTSEQFKVYKVMKNI